MKRRLVVSLLTGVGLGMLLLLFAPRDNPLSKAPTLALSANT
ncbi:MAG: hypothetical protein RIS24_3137, partial [Verrucomicrobiota bacterium]